MKASSGEAPPTWTEDPRSGLVAIPGFGPTSTRTYRYRLGRRHRWGEHHHVEHELLWVASGPIGVAVGDRHWTLHAGVALWLPSGVPHAVDCDVSSSLSCVFFRPEHCPIAWSAPTTVLVDGLVRELIEALYRPAVDPTARHRLEQVLVDQLVATAERPIELALPVDRRAREVAAALAADVADGRSLAEWGRVVGASARTLARGFRQGTGLTFVQWRTQARVRAAVPLLLAGESVTAVALAVGYDSVSPFIEVFRGVTGLTPRAFVAGARPGAVPLRPTSPAAGSPPRRRGA